METSRYPIAAPLTVAGQAFAKVGNVIVTNDNDLEIPRPAQAFSVAVTVESIVRSSIEALCDAKDLLKQIGLGDWFEAYFQAHIDDITTEAVPELHALIERLEVEAKR